MIGLRPLWDDIGKDPLASGAVVRRLLPHVQHDVRIGQSRPEGQRFLELRLFGPIGHVPHRDASTKGLQVKVVLETTERAAIQLLEMTSSPSSQFEELVDDLVDLVDGAPEDGATARVVERLLAWREFFERLSTSLSLERAAGLLAELTVLTTVMVPELGPPKAVSAWTGPDPALQDFQIPGGALEVKSYRGTGAGSLRISSERQLERLPGMELVLAYVPLDERMDGSGETLNEVVNNARTSVASSPSASVEFGHKLVRAGWTNAAAETRKERYSVRALDLLHVREGFPCITQANLPVGVGKVSYQIDRSALEPFLISVTASRRILELPDV